MKHHVAWWIGLGGLIVASLGIVVSEIRLRREARRLFQINPLFEQGQQTKRVSHE